MLLKVEHQKAIGLDFKINLDSLFFIFLCNFEENVNKNLFKMKTDYQKISSYQIISSITSRSPAYAADQRERFGKKDDFELHSRKKHFRKEEN